MRKIYPEPLTADGFRPYGRYYHLGASPDFPQKGVSFIEQAAVHGPIHFGATASPGGDFESSHMERHVLGHEILFCGEEEMFLTVADSPAAGSPRTEDVRCFIMRQRDLVILNKGTWHDANRGIYDPVLYFFVAEDTEGKPDREKETEWVPIEPENVMICSVPRKGQACALQESNHRSISAFSLGKIFSATKFPGFSSSFGWKGFFDPAKTQFTAAKCGWLPADKAFGTPLYNPEGQVAILCAASSVTLLAADNHACDSASEQAVLQCGDIAILPANISFCVAASHKTGVFLMMETNHTLQAANRQIHTGE